MNEFASSGGSADDLIAAGMKHGVSPQNLTSMQNAVLTMKKNASELTKDQLANEQTVHDQTRGRILSIVNGPEGDKQASWASELAKEEKNGTIPTVPGELLLWQVLSVM